MCIKNTEKAIKKESWYLFSSPPCLWRLEFYPGIFFFALKFCQCFCCEFYSLISSHPFIYLFQFDCFAYCNLCIIYYIKFVLIAFLPLSITEYVKPLNSEIHKHTGCVKKQLNPITNTKYTKFTIGWYVLNSLILKFNSFSWWNTFCIGMTYLLNFRDIVRFICYFFCFFI